jgi:hypothetical protein
MEKIIQIVTVLFILSMIFERINEFLKHYLSCKKVVGVGWYIVGDTTTKFPAGSKEEKRREYRILKMNLFIGYLTSFLAHASFFDLLRNLDNPGKVIGWPRDFSLIFKDINFGTPFQFVIGCLFTGAFISMGSKFWHDLLDLLLYTKNLKQKLSSPETFEVTSVDQLTEFLSFTESDLIRIAITQNEEFLRAKFSNIHFLSDSVGIIDGKKKPVAGIHLYDKNENGLPARLPVKLPSGATYQVFTEIISDSGIAKVSGGMEGSIANNKSSDYKGSACCIVKDADEKKYLLTNCHVLTEGDLKNPLHDTDNDTVLYNSDKVGTWFYGTMEGKGDFALVVLTDGDSFLSENEVELFENKFRKIEKEDYFTEVTVRGRISNTSGYILDCIEGKIGIEYNLGNTIVFKKAILLGSQFDRKSCEPVTDFGDSGGAVYDKDKKLIGVITGRNNRFTVVLPVQSFLNDFSLQLL